MYLLLFDIIADSDVELLQYSSDDDDGDRYTDTGLHRDVPDPPPTRSVVMFIDNRETSPKPTEYTYDDVKETPKLVIVIMSVT